ncbi:hypothetical protein BJ166DRAFT_521170 [Pestalotiopsis sp. NC0098]|nr:hypothetical protein BJ166DRAFT_521170 [Pestalotiopsis sp. NC0098]
MEGFLLRDWARIQPSQRDRLSVKLDSSYWAFYGRFESKSTSLSFELATSKLEDFTITELAIYPQKYASSETVRTLRKRGEMLWKCREPYYVSSIIHSDYGLQETVKI